MKLLLPKRHWLEIILKRLYLKNKQIHNESNNIHANTGIKPRIRAEVAIIKQTKIAKNIQFL